MLWFLGGLLVGGILGVIIMAILTVGSIADENREYMMKHLKDESSKNTYSLN